MRSDGVFQSKLVAMIAAITPNSTENILDFDINIFIFSEIIC